MLKCQQKLGRVMRKPALCQTHKLAIGSWFRIQKNKAGHIISAANDKGTFQPAQLKWDLVAWIPVKQVFSRRGYS